MFERSFPKLTQISLAIPLACPVYRTSLPCRAVKVTAIYGKAITLQQGRRRGQNLPRRIAVRHRFVLLISVNVIASVDALYNQTIYTRSQFLLALQVQQQSSPFQLGFLLTFQTTYLLPARLSIFLSLFLYRRRYSDCRSSAPQKSSYLLSI